MMCTRPSLLKSLLFVLMLVTIDCSAGKGDKKSEEKTVAQEKRSAAIGKNKTKHSAKKLAPKQEQFVAAAAVAVTVKRQLNLATATPLDPILDALGVDITLDAPVTALTIPSYKALPKAIITSFYLYFGTLIPLLDDDPATEEMQSQLAQFLQKLDRLKTVTSLNVIAIAPEFQAKFWTVVGELLNIRSAIEQSNKSPEAIKDILIASEPFKMIDAFEKEYPRISATLVGAATGYAGASGSLGARLFGGFASLKTVLKGALDADFFKTNVEKISAALNLLDTVLSQIQEVQLPAEACKEAKVVLERYGLKATDNVTFRRASR